MNTDMSNIEVLADRNRTSNAEHRSGEGSVDLGSTAENGAAGQPRPIGDRLTILSGHVIEKLKEIAAGSVQCVVTSPPYWGLRSYLPKGHALKSLEIGQEATPDCGGWRREEGGTLIRCGKCYVCTMLAVFGGKENPVGIWRGLRDDGTVWLNLGDSYCNTDKWGGGKTNTGKHTIAENGDVPSFAVRSRKASIPGVKPKDLIGIPWRVALALQAAGWYLRSDIIWAKPNCMPESVTDRPTRSHEYLFLLTKSSRYFYDAEAIKEPCIYDVAGQGTAARPANGKHRTSNIERPTSNGGYKNSVNFDGKNKGNDKQRGHSRRHDGFNDRWDAMEKEEQCTGMRNKRDVWTISPANYPEAHFATFPPELIKPCILAGTAAGGACALCGSPLKRKIEVGSLNLEHQRACGGDAQGEYNGASTKDHAAHGVQDASAVKSRILEGLRERKTVGWELTCKCGRSGIEQGNKCQDKKTVPCIVLDPFGGSGTTGEVALELGRRAILIELNPEYLPLIERRTDVTPGLAI